LTDASIDTPAPVDAAAIDAPPDAFVDTSLMLRYDFEDSMTATKVADSSSRGKNGTLSDVAAWTTAGRTNHGIALAGGLPPAFFVTFPDGVLTGVSDFTISAWVKPNTIANWIRIYDFGHGTPGTPDARWMFLTLHGFPPGLTTPDGVHASSFSAAGPSEIISASGTEIPVGVWKHVAVTGSGGVRTLYIDGYPAATTTTALSVPPSDMEPIGGTSWIGKSRFVLTDAGLDGTLDEFRIYNRVLSQTEIADLAWPQHDYSYWRFDETSGQTAKDSSDNAVPTALMSGTAWVAGKIGGALDLPGGPHNPTGPHAEFATSPLHSCTDQLTVATWVKLHSQDGWARIFDFGTGGGLFTYLTVYDGTNQHGMHFAMVSPGGIFDIATTSPPIAGDDTWHHVAVTVVPAAPPAGPNDEVVTMYVDGAVVQTQTNSTGAKVSDFTATTENYLGKSRFVDTDPYLHAALDDLRISCRAFTADEIKSLAHQ
jgi:hypothetical protein